MDEEEFICRFWNWVLMMRDEDDVFEVITTPDSFMDIKEAMEAANYKIGEADVVLLPENTVEINELDTAVKVIKLIELLEDHDDVQNVYANMDIPDEIMEKL